MLPTLLPDARTKVDINKIIYFSKVREESKGYCSGFNVSHASYIRQQNNMYPNTEVQIISIHLVMAVGE